MSKEQQEMRIEHYELTSETAPMVNIVKAYMERIPEILEDDSVSKGLALMGSYGIGKSMLAAIVANKLLESKVPVAFVVTPDLMGELKMAQFQEGGKELEEKIQKLSTIPVVVFDDLGKEKITEWVQTQYFRIVDGRYRNRLATIITSNYSFAELDDRLGEAVSSRIYQLTKNAEIYLKAENYRMK